MAVSKQSLGKKGEDYVACQLEKAGLKIITRNYRCPKGEMDIIAWDHETLVFIEVRTRQSSFRGWGEESVTLAKARRLQAVAAFYVLQNGYKNWPDMRFDVAAVRWTDEEPVWKWIQSAL